MEDVQHLADQLFSRSELRKGNHKRTHEGEVYQSVLPAFLTNSPPVLRFKILQKYDQSQRSREDSFGYRDPYRVLL